MHTTPDQKTPGLVFWAKAMPACGLRPAEDNTGFACCCLAGGDVMAHSPRRSPPRCPLVWPLRGRFGGSVLTFSNQPEKHVSFWLAGTRGFESRVGSTGRLGRCVIRGTRGRGGPVFGASWEGWRKRRRGRCLPRPSYRAAGTEAKQRGTELLLPAPPTRSSSGATRNVRRGVGFLHVPCRIAPLAPITGRQLAGAKLSIVEARRTRLATQCGRLCMRQLIEPLCLCSPPPPCWARTTKQHTRGVGEWRPAFPALWLRLGRDPQLSDSRRVPVLQRSAPLLLSTSGHVPC